MVSKKEMCKRYKIITVNPKKLTLVLASGKINNANVKALWAFSGLCLLSKWCTQSQVINAIAYPHGEISFQANKLSLTLLFVLHAKGNLKALEHKIFFSCF